MTSRTATTNAPDDVRSASAPLLLDQFQDTFDTTIAAHAIVDAPVPLTYSAARELDFLEVRSPLLIASMWARTVPMKVLGRPAPQSLAKLSLGDDMGMPGWMTLAENPGHEVVFGAVGVFWGSDISFNEQIGTDQFAAFDEPGWGKIACNFTTFPYGEHRTLLTYECRTRTTDATSARRFARYWWLVRPFVGHIMGATVRTIRHAAESTASPPGPAKAMRKGAGDSADQTR